MPISHRFKTIFIHIPKTAGESIEKTLGMSEGSPDENLNGIIENKILLQHLTGEVLKKDYIKPEIWIDYFKFSVVRNPWSRSVSEYNWFLRYGTSITFSEWVKSLETRIKINKSINPLEVGHNIEQYKFLFNQSGKLMVDELIFFEDLNNSFNNICKKKNWPVDLIYAESTKSPSKIDFRLYYDIETAEIIHNIYKKDVDLFGYSLKKTFSKSGLRKTPVRLDTFFNADLYLSLNKDINKEVDPLWHYLNFGIREGRRIK